MIERPLWHERSSMPSTQSACASADVLIVGGGITGLVAGIELLQAGASVMIADAMTPGESASGRAFGSIAIGSSASLGQLCALHGQQTGERLWREASDAAQNMHNYCTTNNIDCDYRKTGHIRLAVTPGHEKALRADLISWNRVLGGRHLRLLSAEELQSQLPSTRFRLGLLDEMNVSIDPYRYLSSLLSRFNALGGCYVANCEVMNIQRDGNGFTTTHQQGVTRSREMIIASNGYTGHLMPWLRRRFFTVGSYMIAIAPLPPHLRQAFDPRLRVCSTAYNLKNYFRLDSEHRLIFGGRSNLGAVNAAADIASELKRAMLAYFPSLHEVEVTHVWGGKLGFTFDGILHIGKHNEIHYGLGYCGRGLPMATLLASNLLQPLTASKARLVNITTRPLMGAGIIGANLGFSPLPQHCIGGKIGGHNLLGNVC